MSCSFLLSTCSSAGLSSCCIHWCHCPTTCIIFMQFCIATVIVASISNGPAFLCVMLSGQYLSYSTHYSIQHLLHGRNLWSAHTSHNKLPYCSYLEGFSYINFLFQASPVTDYTVASISNNSVYIQFIVCPRFAHSNPLLLQALTRERMELYDTH